MRLEIGAGGYSTKHKLVTKLKRGEIPLVVRSYTVNFPLLEKLQLYKLLPFNRKEIIFEQGDPAFGLYYLCTGAVKLQRRTRSGHQQLLALLQGQGYLIGMEALLGDRHDYTAQALKESQILFIAREELSHVPRIELFQAAGSASSLFGEATGRYVGVRSPRAAGTFFTSAAKFGPKTAGASLPRRSIPGAYLSPSEQVRAA